MSYVTDVILINSGINRKQLFKDIDTWLHARYHCLMNPVDDLAGGNKVMQSEIYMGAFNGMNIGEFIEYLNSLKWDNNEDVQLLIKDENDEIFTLWHFKGGGNLVEK